MSGLFRWLVGSITTSPTTDPVEWMASRARSERRKPQLRKVESMSSSREASEESNAENTEGELLTSDASDEVVLPAVVHPGSSGGSEGILDSEALPGRVRAGVRAVGPTNTLLARGSFADPAAEDSSASTYDGDVSSATAASKRHNSQTTAVPSDSTTTHPLLHERAVHTACNNTISPTASPPSTCPPSPPTLPLRPPHEHEHKHTEAHAPAPHGMISKISPEELQDFIRHIITGDLPGPNGQKRTYSINPPPLDRPVRIYADGVYDLFHYAHALQLRQAKLFFPHVHLLVGVSSDELVKSYKALPVLNSEERYESVRNCKWVDEVIEDAPWEVDQAFIDKHQIDYIAHDEEPYVSLTSSDVYAYAKSIGKFLPTRRTSGISTSELLSRIVDGYRGGDYDNKLSKIGRSDIMSRPPSENGSARSRTNSRLNSPVMGSSSAALDRSLTGLTMSSRSQSPIRPQPAHPLEQSQLA